MGKIDKRAALGGDRDPSRAALAEAIARRNELAASVAALRAAQSPTRDRVSDARDALSRATDDIRTAKEAAVAHIISTATGQSGDAPATVESARRKLVAAEDDLEVAKVARDTLVRRLTEEETQLRWAQDRVKDAALGVLRLAPAVETLLQEVEELQRALIDKGDALDWVVAEGLMSPEARKTGNREITREGTAVDRLGTPPRRWVRLYEDSAIPGRRPWMAALAALMEDADAPLPGDDR